MRPIKDTFTALRCDAIERGMDYLAIVYGWSAIRLGQEYLDNQKTQLEMYRQAKVELDKSRR